MTDPDAAVVVCVDCGLKLRTPQSVARRRGPVCQEYFAPTAHIPTGGALPRSTGRDVGPDLLTILAELLGPDPAPPEGVRA